MNRREFMAGMVAGTALPIMAASGSDASPRRPLPTRFKPIDIPGLAPRPDFWKVQTKGICLGWEDPLEEGMATHSSVLAWRIPMDRVA